jgi:hypothetical protein
MTASDALTTIAEVAVALVGFSGLVAALLGRAAGTWDTRDVAAFWQIIGFSAAALLFALLPFPLHFLGLSEAAVWLWLSAVLAVLSLAWALAALLVPVRLARRGLTMRFPRGSRVVPLFAFALSLVLFLNSADLLISRGPGVYLLALTSYLAMSLLYFGGLIHLAIRRKQSDET